MASTTTLKASLISKSEISFMDKLAFLRAIGIAIDGAIVNFFGSVAASPMETILANGFKFFESTKSFDASTNAEAPSLSVEEFAAVTVPNQI